MIIQSEQLIIWNDMCIEWWWLQNKVDQDPDDKEPSSRCSPIMPRPTPKPLDEDLYRLSPEILYSKYKKVCPFLLTLSIKLLLFLFQNYIFIHILALLKLYVIFAEERNEFHFKLLAAKLFWLKLSAENIINCLLVCRTECIYDKEIKCEMHLFGVFTGF